MSNPTIDRTHLEAICAAVKKSDFLTRLIGKFEKHGVTTLHRVSAAVQSGNNAEYQDALHALIGTARDVGAVQLEAVCRTAKETGIANPQAIDDLQTALQMTLTALADYMNSATAAKPDR